MNRYPPFRAAPEHATRDVSTKSGAEMLAREIKARWAACGVNVQTSAHETVVSQFHSVWGVKITGLNGKLTGQA